MQIATGQPVSAMGDAPAQRAESRLDAMESWLEQERERLPLLVPVGLGRVAGRSTDRQTGPVRRSGFNRGVGAMTATAATYNFAYLDEQTKRMIRRAILKAIEDGVIECYYGAAPERVDDLRPRAHLRRTVERAGVAADAADALAQVGEQARERPADAPDCVLAADPGFDGQVAARRRLAARRHRCHARSRRRLSGPHGRGHTVQHPESARLYRSHRE